MAEETLRDIFAKNWLDSVIFVMDYVQFTFNGPILSAFVRPTIQVDGAVLRWRDWAIAMRCASRLHTR